MCAFLTVYPRNFFYPSYPPITFLLYYSSIFDVHIISSLIGDTSHLLVFLMPLIQISYQSFHSIPSIKFSLKENKLKKMGCVPNLSQFVPICPNLSQFVPICPNLSPICPLIILSTLLERKSVLLEEE